MTNFDYVNEQKNSFTEYFEKRSLFNN